jgi:hypothetical protein
LRHAGTLARDSRVSYTRFARAMRPA